jgi:tripartite-type tricarboxylate transporter receptor subunit TctC
MKLPRRRFLHLAVGAAALPALPRVASAQAYPTRPVTIVDTSAPGGATGIIAHILADKFSETAGQQFVVNQRAGAGGTVGAREIARSAPDGYTMMLGFTGNLAIAPSLYSNPGYDPRKDFASIGRIGNAPSILVAHPSVPARTVAELIAYAKQNPGKVSFGSAGAGSGSHISGELFASMAEIKLRHVPYQGAGPALADLIEQRISVLIAPIPVTRESAKNGLVRMLGVTSLARSSLLADIPTIAEQGLPGYEVVLRFGLVVPSGTPRPIIERLNTELRAVLSTDEMRARFATVGVEPLPSTPEEYAADIASDETKWSMLVRSLGLKAE